MVVQQLQASAGRALTRQRSEDMEDALLEVRRVFDTVDLDGSGAIGFEELGLLLESLGQPERSQAELRHTVQQMDADGSGEIEFEEFNRLLCEWQEDELRSVFAYFDRDESGEIDIAEFRKALTALGQSITPERLEELVAEADTDQSGSITLDEFCVFVRPYMSMTGRCEYAATDADTGESVGLMLTSVGCELTRRGARSSGAGGLELLPYFRITGVQVEGAVVALTRCAGCAARLSLPRCLACANRCSPVRATRGPSDPILGIGAGVHASATSEACSNSSLVCLSRWRVPSL